MWCLIWSKYREFPTLLHIVSLTLPRGVNMYAMLVGKLPFRSPRQGTKWRQKLQEQIQAGLPEGHE